MVVISSRIEVKTPLVGTCSSSMSSANSSSEDVAAFSVSGSQYLLETPNDVYVKEKESQKPHHKHSRYLEALDETYGV